MAEPSSTPIESWTESMVSTWLRSIGVKENYIEKLHEEEVDGKALVTLTQECLQKTFGMKFGPARVIIEEMKKLSNQKVSQKNKKKASASSDQDKPLIKNQSGSDSAQQCQMKGNVSIPILKDKPLIGNQPGSESAQQCKMEGNMSIPMLKDSKPRPFGKPGIDHKYTKHDVLQPETGGSDLITACHEYKAFNTAALLDPQRIQAKLGYEVLKFATGCMNIRSNGTIHFGIRDSKEDSSYVHGEIIGIPIKKKDVYTDALNYIEKSFECDPRIIRQCIRPPEFILVVDTNIEEPHYVVEFDVEPSVDVVRGKVFSVCLPKYNEDSNRVLYEKETIYQRVGAKTEPVNKMKAFIDSVSERDAQRERAEKACFPIPEPYEDLGVKLVTLATCGKGKMEETKWYILVTNKFAKEDLGHIDFLLNMKLFCVFDFDPDSRKSGLCHEYAKHHAVNLHFMKNYNSDKSHVELESQLHLFEQTSWIFCNGRNDFKGNEPPCDEATWFRTKMSLLKDCVSFICKTMLPKGTFLVFFILTAPVQKPLLSTFCEFFTVMGGHEDIVCISESDSYFKKLQTYINFTFGPCDMRNLSIVGLKMSHVNATIQQVQATSVRVTKLLPLFCKATCPLETRDEEWMCSLDILTVNHCEQSKRDDKSAHEDIERDFYRGGKVTWMNFWLAEEGLIGEMIQRDAYQTVIGLLNDCLKVSSDQMPIKYINIYHHPGSGGSTVARQVLWKHRKELRCAVVKQSSSAVTVAEHAVKFREYEEKETEKCLPVLLLVEDSDKEYLEDLKKELVTAVTTKKIVQATPCFILLNCRRSYDPEKICRTSPLLNVSVTQTLSDKEKQLFARKRQTLEQHFQPQFILTFVLMCEGFEDQVISKYVKNFVEHLVENIDHASDVTKLIRYVALLNAYVEDSFISQSHCEALLSSQIVIRQDRFRRHEFETFLSDQAKLLFIHLRDDRTNIQSIRIIHHKVANEILYQLLGDKPQSELALELLSNDLLFEHRFGRREFRKFLRELFMRRYKISRGDKSDSQFSPLIEHVRGKERPGKATELLEKAYERFDKDAFFAQQLARLNYYHDWFEAAEKWAKIAVNKLPGNSYFLDTKGQVYKRWFTSKSNAMDNTTKTAETTADAIEKALTAIECFQKCQKAADTEQDTMNSSGFFGLVEVGCRLLKLMSSLPVFSNDCNGRSELVRYLLTDYIPEEINKAWKPFHSQLKQLQPTMHKSLDRISEELNYFQTELYLDEEETSKSCDQMIYNPKRWLENKSSLYAEFFCEALPEISADSLSTGSANVTSFTKRMKIYQLGGGNLANIFSILDSKDKKPKEKSKRDKLEDIISLYQNLYGTNMDRSDLANYLALNLALCTLSPNSTKILPLNKMQKLIHPFLGNLSKCSTDALFLFTMLFWPEDNDNGKVREEKFQTIFKAVKLLTKSYWNKMKSIPPRKQRIYTHFYLGKRPGYNKFVHKSQLKNFPSVSGHRLKWFEGEIFKTPEVAQALKRVSGWTEDRTVYLEGPGKEPFPIHALNEQSLPSGNENVTFYLGFTYRGPVACDITKTEN